jgi:hypothetical protein
MAKQLQNAKGAAQFAWGLVCFNELETGTWTPSTSGFGPVCRSILAQSAYRIEFAKWIGQ